MQEPLFHRYPAGSIRLLWAVSFPLILSGLSSSLMFFCDRLILGFLSLQAMNAAAVAGMCCYVFHYGAIGIANIAEVFVGQLNGRKEYALTGGATWQMLWFSVFTIAIFVPLGQLAGPALMQMSGQPLTGAIDYYRWFMSGGFVFALNAAVAGFFIGRGEVRLVTISVVLANVANLVLDYVLIFGYFGLPRLEVAGAAMATIGAQVLQFAILFSVFLRSDNRARFGTGRYQVQWRFMFEQLRVGFPNSLSHMMEISAWSLLLFMMTHVSALHVTVFSIGQAFFMLLVFFTDGVQKGVIALCSNYIGAKEHERVQQVYRCAQRLIGAFVLCIAVPFLCFPSAIVAFFTHDVQQGLQQQVMAMAPQLCLWLWVFCSLDGAVWVTAGVLTAANDTFYVMCVHAFTAVFCAILPIYWLVVKSGGSALLTWQLACVYSLSNLVLLWLRYARKGWAHKPLAFHTRSQ